jgi:hypothetical protein
MNFFLKRLTGADLRCLSGYFTCKDKEITRGTLNLILIAILC